MTSNNPPKKRRGWKIAGIVVLVLLLAAGGYAAWFSAHYKGIIKKKLPLWVARATDSLYKVEVQDISINLATRRVTVTGLRLYPDTARLTQLRRWQTAPQTVFNIEVPSLHVSGVQWATILTDKELRCNALTLQDPTVLIDLVPVDTQKIPIKEKREPAIQQIGFGSITLRNPTIAYGSTKSGDSSELRVAGGTITFYNWELDTQRPADTTRILLAESAVLAVDTFSYTKQGDPYLISCAGIYGSTADDTLNLTDFRVTTTVDKTEFYSMVGHQKDLFNAYFPRLSLQGMSWRQMLNGGQLMVDRLAAPDARLSIYFSRMPPPNPESKLGKYPHQILQKIKLPLLIKTIRLDNGRFTYTEVAQKSGKAGELLFENISGDITNATNIPALTAANNECVVDMKGTFMGGSPVQATFQFDLTDPAGGFAVEGHLQNMQGPALNRLTKPLALAEVKSLNIKSLDVYIEGNEREGSGEVRFVYSGMDIVLQGVDTTAQGKKEIEDKEVLSFLANSLILYPNNPMEGEPVRTATTYVQRDQYKSFFNLIWKNIFDGVKQTAVRSDAVLEAMEANGEGKKKKGFFRRLFGGKKKNEEEKTQK